MEWISVDKKQPRERKPVLVYSAGIDVYCAVLRLDGQNYECLEGGELLLWVPTHWMPLPDPPTK